MNNLLSFAYESGICMAVIYCMYWLFLRKETYFRFNRFYLLCTILFACLIPLGNFKIAGLNSDSTAFSMITGLGESIRLKEVVIAGRSRNLFSLSSNLEFLIILIYLLGVSIFLGRMFAGIIRIIKLKKSGKRIRSDSYSVVYIQQDLPPFSFFGNIFMNESFRMDSRQDHIVAHEMVHIRQLHTFDNLVVEVFLALFWFNPFIWLLRKSLRSTHEYLADLGVRRTDTSLEGYQSVLLGQVNGLFPLSLTNNFNSMIKKRIKMMYKRKSTVPAKLKPLLVAPVLLCLVLIFSCSDSQIELQQKNLTLEQEELLKSEKDIETADEEVYFIVEEMPSFQGMGQEAFRQWIADHLEYPKDAEKKGISGKVYVQFIVNSEGRVTGARVVRGIHPSLDAEAIRVVESSPAWEPGKQRGKNISVVFTFPINFVLE